MFLTLEWKIANDSNGSAFISLCRSVAVYACRTVVSCAGTSRPILLDRWQFVEKAIHGFFNIVNRTPLSRIPALRGIGTSCPATRFSIDSHFQWLEATDNGGTSMYRAQPVEKRCFSTRCWSLLRLSHDRTRCTRHRNRQPRPLMKYSG